MDIQPPDYETRVAIIKNKAIRRGMNLPDPVLQYICGEHHLQRAADRGNRQQKFLAFQELMGESVDVDTVTRAVRDMFKDKADFLPSPDIIIDEVSKFYNTTPTPSGAGPHKDTALARQIAMYQIRRMTNLSLKEIGKEFEGRDHTTVMHSIDRIEKLTKTNPEIAEVIKDINANINARYE